MGRHARRGSGKTPSASPRGGAWTRLAACIALLLTSMAAAQDDTVLVDGATMATLLVGPSELTDQELSVLAKIPGFALRKEACRPETESYLWDRTAVSRANGSFTRPGARQTLLEVFSLRCDGMDTRSSQGFLVLYEDDELITYLDSGLGIVAVQDVDLDFVDEAVVYGGGVGQGYWVANAYLLSFAAQEAQTVAIFEGVQGSSCGAYPDGLGLVSSGRVTYVPGPSPVFTTVVSEIGCDGASVEEVLARQARWEELGRPWDYAVGSPELPLENATEAVRTASDDGADIEARDERGFTPLMAAATSASVESVEVLISAGADVNARTADAWTPLLLAARDGQNPAVIQTLLAAGADAGAVPDGSGYRDALWYALRNPNLQGSLANLTLAVAKLVAASIGAPVGSLPALVTPGHEPYLQPEPAPSGIEVVLSEGLVNLTATTEARITGRQAGTTTGHGTVDMKFELVEWRMPVVLAHRTYVAVIEYVQRMDATTGGDLDAVGELVREMEDEAVVRVYEVRGGTLGDVVVAFKTDSADTEPLDSLGFVPLGQFALARFAARDTRVGLGARIATEEAFEVDGVRVAFSVSDEVTGVSPDEVRSRGSESSTTGPFIAEEFYGTTTGFIESSLTYEATHRLNDARATLLVDGEMTAALTFSLQDNDGQFTMRVSMRGPMSVRGSKVAWEGLPAETQRGVLTRIVRLVAEGLY